MRVGIILLLEPHRYQLWVYIYQARDLLAFDDSGMNGKLNNNNSLGRRVWHMSTIQP